MNIFFNMQDTLNFYQEFTRYHKEYKKMILQISTKTRFLLLRKAILDYGKANNIYISQYWSVIDCLNELFEKRREKKLNRKQIVSDLGNLILKEINK